MNSDKRHDIETASLRHMSLRKTEDVSRQYKVKGGYKICVEIAAEQNSANWHDIKICPGEIRCI